MRIQSLSTFISLAAVCGALYAEETRAIPPPTKPAFVFRDVGYFHRWSQNDQHEFTPEGQQDLDKWSDMITANAYPDVDDGKRLAEKANAVLEKLQESPGQGAQDQFGPSDGRSAGGTLDRRGVWPAEFHRSCLCPVQAGGWKRMLLRLFPSYLRRKNRGPGECLAKCQRRGD